MEETVETPENGDSEEIAAPSDEENADTEGDDIANEDPAEEDPATEEPSEGDVEEVEEPTIGVMVDGVDDTPADNTFNVTWEVSQNYTITGKATATADEDYTFKVEAKPNYRIDTVTYKVGTEDAKVAAGTDGNYTIKKEEIKADIVISVEAVQTVTVTVTAPDTVTVKCTVGDGADQDVKSGTSVTVDKGAKVKLTVTPVDATIDVTAVKKGSTVIKGEGNVYDLGEITANATYAVTATKNRYTITQTVNQIKVTEGDGDNAKEVTKDSAEIIYSKSGSDYTEAKGSDPQMITKKKDLKFELKYDDYFNEKTPKVVVSYKVGAAETATPLTASNGVYTIPNAKINGDIALNVYVAEYRTLAVTMLPDENVAKIQYAIGAEALKDFPEAAQGAQNGERVLTDVTEDSVLKFQLTAKKYYKIKEVKAGDEVLKADTKGVYTLTVSEAKTITVTTEANPAEQRNLTFKVTGDAKSASALITDGLGAEKTVEAGATVNDLAAATGDELTLTITPEPGYIIKGVSGAAEVPETAAADTDAKQYKVKFTSTKTATVTVTTDADASTKESKVTFTEDSSVSHMNYNVKTGTTGVTKDEDGNGKYTVAKGAKKLEFSITVTGSYKPTVNMTGKDVENKDPENGDEEGGQNVKAREAETPIEIKYAKMTPTKTGATYDYVIPATQLKDENAITISETEDVRTITLGGTGFDNVNIVASIDGVKTPADDESEGKEYTVLLNTVVAFQITAKANTDLTKVVSTIGTKDTIAKITNNTATVEVKVTDVTTIDITTKDQYVASPLKENGVDLKPADEAKNSYNVAYNGMYTATLVKGIKNTSAALSDVKVLLGNASVAVKTEGDKVGSIDETDKNKAIIDLSKADVEQIKGKTLTVELYVNEGTEEAAANVKVATYSLIVSAPATGIKIDKQTDLKATQAIDTKKTYTVTADKGVDLKKLVAVVTADTTGIIATTADEDDNNDQGAKAAAPQIEYENGKLTVTLAAKEPEEGASATITIKEDGVTGDDASKATLTITPADLINDNTAAPTVKMVAATDVAFKLTLSAQTGQAVSGKLYYKVESKEKKEGATPKTTYVQKEGDSQTAMVTVSDAGREATYEVKASLVHLDREVTNATTLGDAKTLGKESKGSNKQTLKTQTPAYEDKLKLKKGKTTIVTGEQNIVIAEPQYNKYTTFLSLAKTGAVKDITPNLKDDEKLTLEVKTVGLDEKIYAAATQKTWVGKHKIQVTASAEMGAYASVATIDVTVVRGIHKLDVTVPSTNLYKANKKASKVKATVVYNQVENMSSPAPKNKSVKWEIEGVGANKSYIEKMVTVNNGTVNVDKNFIVDTVAENNQFKIKVTANNDKTFAGGTYNNNVLEPIVGESPVITITGQGEDIKTLAIVKADDDGKTYIKALSGSNEGVPASDIHEGQVVVLNSKATGLQIGDEYKDAANQIDLDLLTLKSSNQKNVPVDATGEIKVNKVGKVNLTATAKDGSNKKADLSLNIINDGTEGTLGLNINGAEYDKSGQPEAKSPAAVIYDFTAGGETNISYDFTETPVVQLTVKQKVTKEGTTTVSEVPDFANFTLTVQGGKIVQQKGTEAFVAMNSKTVTVKLTDKSKKSDNVATYVLTNTGVDGKPTFKAKNKLHSKGTVDEQTADIEVSKLANLDGKQLVAKVAVDWSAKNAKNEKDLQDLAEILKDEYSLDTVNENGSKFTLDFKSEDKNAEITLNQKSYKLKVTLYERNEVTPEGATESTVTDTAVTAPTSLTVSVDSAKKFTFKPTTSYTLKTRDVKASAELTGKPSVTDCCTVTWSNLQNVNTKGKTNKFKNYFDVATGEDGKPYIKLINLNEGNLPDKEDCTGYITYTATAKMNYLSDKAVTGTVKITVKFDDKKPQATYSQKKENNQLPVITLNTGSKTKTVIEAKVGKQDPAAAKLAYVTGDTQDFTVVKGTSDGEIELTYTGTGLAKNKTYKVKLYIVPEGSYYKEIIDKELQIQQTDESETAAEKAARLTALYGISVTVQVKAVEQPSEEKNYTVTITDGPSSVKQGEEVTYTAEVKENGQTLAGATVSWNVAAKKDSTLASGTGIDGDGKLTVAAGQDVNSVLLITATYTPTNGNPVVSEAKEVTVTANN